MQLSLPTPEDVAVAVARLNGVAHHSPIMTSTTLDAMTGARLYLKCENLQRGGAFKFRGAYNAIAALSPAQRTKGVVAFSSGNHAQAMALAGRLQGVSVSVVMPHDAPAVKVAATRGYGAEVIFYDRYKEDREAIGRDLAEKQGRALIPSYDHPDVIAGQGTAAHELFQDIEDIDVLISPLGGGGLLAGSILAAERAAPNCLLYGVEPEAGDDGRQSLKRGEIVHISPPVSIADGAVVTHLGHHTFPIIQRKITGIVTVSDTQLVAAMSMLAERLKIIAEPTGCLGLAAALTGAVDVKGKRVGVLISGGNIDLSRFGRLVSTPRN
ncbi:MAG: threo-3-hydroxy-L-aspartate ammonia-lyase [Rhodospirillaceae bacterium]|nr:threo-3-hydroxy-L-aspartate ammonia-lyase [Rhodospirillaceae bacterium]